MTPSMMMQASPHRDVLEAKPDSAESKARLVEELQSRGRAAVGAKSWMDAKLLYEKALAVVDDNDKDKSKTALLNSNLSLVLKSMGDFEEARKCADRATQADPTYLKGWWRLGQALQSLKRSQDALDAFAKAKELEPTNKALLKEYEKLSKIVEEEKALMQDNDTPMEDVSNTMSTTTTTTNTNTVPAPAPAVKSAATTTTPTEKTTTTKPKATTKHDDDDGVFTKSDAVRGYKVVNGKKTSYFHNELSEEAKTLIGDIAPKKLDSAEAPVIKAAPKGASAWNKAGTWEEKDVSKWALSSLKEQILQTTFTLPESSPAGVGAVVTVTKVKTLDGHASHAMARGKKRYIYEFLCKLEWQLTGPNGLDCSGSLALPDIDGTIDLGEGYEIHDFSISSVSDNSLRPLIDRFVYRGGFHESLNHSIDDWVRKFKSEY